MLQVLPRNFGELHSARAQRAEENRNGVPLEVADDRVRDVLGRYVVPQKPVAIVAQFTRQQRRHQERMAAKVARSWSDVTNGDGLVLVDGVPIDPAKAEGVKP